MGRRPPMRRRPGPNGSLWRELDDARRPVAQRRARSSATPEAGAESRYVSGETAALRDVLGREPDGVAVDRGRSIVAPARAPTEDVRVLGEAVLQTRPGLHDVDIARADLRIERDVSDAGEVGVAGQGEGDHPAAALGRGGGREEQTGTIHSHVTLLEDLGLHPGAAA